MAKQNTPRVDERLAHWLRALTSGLDAGLTAKAAAHGLSLNEWRLIRDLDRHGGLVPSVIAARLAITRGAVTKMVARLEARRLVLNLESELDFKYRVVALDEAGLTLAEEVAAISNDQERRFFGPVEDAEKERFLATLQALVAHHRLQPPIVESGK